MATLTELSGLLNDPTLTDKCRGAVLVAANVIKNEDSGTANHANRLKWAKLVLNDPSGQATRMLRAVLAVNNAATLAQITAADDATIQAAVNGAIDILADGSA